MGGYDGDPPPNRNFRQIGTKRGPPQSKKKEKRRPRQPPSIPSKYQVQVKADSDVKNGFGSRTSRFGASKHNLPGPGYYHKSASMTKDKPSVSKKGFGVGFVSKSDRFKKPLAMAFNPGPGAYEKNSFTDKTVASFSRLQTTGVFAGSERFKPSRASNVDAPGPGEYQRVRTGPGRRLKQSSTFRSSTKRDSYMKQIMNNDVPAPGAYEPEAAPSPKNQKPSSTFASVTKRLNDFNKNTPGPGSYDFNPSKKPDGLKGSNRGSSMFCNTKQDRFGQSYVKKVDRGFGVPGPGHYTQEFQTKSKAPASSSWAVSTTQRGVDKGRRAIRPPGPSYYQPEVQTKRSYHLNASARWV